MKKAFKRANFARGAPARMLLVLAAACSQAFAEDLAPTPSLDELPALVKALASQEYAQRQPAQMKLALLVDRHGPGAEKALSQYHGHQDADVAAAIAAQLGRIGQMKADRKLFEWYDGLGFPCVKDTRLIRIAGTESPKPFGRIVASRWTSDGKDYVAYTYGFVVNETPESRVLFTGWTERTNRKAQQDGWGEFELIDCARHIRDFLKAATEKDIAASDPFRGERTRSSPCMELFVQARFAQLLGLHGESRRLMEMAETAAAASQRGRRAEPNADFLENLKTDAAHALTWEAVLACNEKDPTRKQLIQRFKFIQKNFPDSKHKALVDEMVEQLEKMIEEDAAHAKLPAKKWKDMTKAEQIAELIYQLREQNGHQYSQPGSCDIFADWGGAGENKLMSPAHKLVELGFDAVPALIEILEDKRLTRSVGYHRNFYFSHHVLRYSDCALRILERIANRSFYLEVSTFSYASKDGQAPTVKKVIQAWWADVQTKGFDQVLLESIQKADENSPGAAQLLLKRDKQKALPETIGAARKAQNAWVRSSLIELAASVEGPDVVPFLLEEARGPSHDSRMAAVRELHRLKRPEAVAIAMEEARETAPPAAIKYDGWDESPRLWFAKFLISTKDLQALKCVVERYPNWKAGERYRILDAMGEIETKDESALRVVEQFLADSLDDDGHAGISGSRGNVSFSDPRLGDMAAYFLGQRWKFARPFPFQGARLDRETYIVGVRNAWRKKNGQATLPAPETPRIAALDPGVARDLAQKLKKANGGAQAREVLGDYESHGLGALPALKAAVDALSENHPARNESQAGIPRLASIVRKATIHPKSQPFPRRLDAAFHAFQGKPLTSVALSDWMGEVLKEKKGALEIEWERAGDGTGIEMTVKFQLPTRSREGIHYTSSYRAGGESLGGANGSGSLEHHRKNWQAEAREKIQQLLNAPAHVPCFMLYTASWAEEKE